MGVNSLPKTVTRQRRACDFWTRALLRMVRFLVYDTGLVQYRWTGLDLLIADRLKMQDWKIVNSSKYSKLLYLRFSPLQIRTSQGWKTFSVLAFSTLVYSYLRIPYLHIPSSGTFVFRTCVFSRPGSLSSLHFKMTAASILGQRQAHSTERLQTFQLNFLGIDDCINSWELLLPTLAVILKLR